MNNIGNHTLGSGTGAQPQGDLLISRNITLNATGSPTQTVTVPFSVSVNRPTSGILAIEPIGNITLTNQTGTHVIYNHHVIAEFTPYYGHPPFNGIFTILVSHGALPGIYTIPVNSLGPISLNTTVSFDLMAQLNATSSGVQNQSVVVAQNQSAAQQAGPIGNSSLAYVALILIAVIIILVVILLNGKRQQPQQMPPAGS